MTSAVVLVTTGVTDGGAAGLLRGRRPAAPAPTWSDHTLQTSVTYAGCLIALVRGTESVWSWVRSEALGAPTRPRDSRG